MSEHPSTDEASTVYFQGKPVTDFHEAHHHVSPVWVYVAVLVGLFILTGLTYAVSFANLGPASLPVAMIVAVMKASLVCAFFMHLAHDDRFYVFIFVSTLLFVAIFFAFTMFDISNRDRINPEQGTFFRREYDAKTWDADKVYEGMKGGHHGEGEHGDGDHPEGEGEHAEGDAEHPEGEAKADDSKAEAKGEH